MSASSSIFTTYSSTLMIPKNTKNTFEKYSDVSNNTDFMSALINVFSLSTLSSTSVLSSPDGLKMSTAKVQTIQDSDVPA